MKYFFLNYEYTYKYKIKRFQAWINVYQISLSASIKSKLWKKNLEKVQKFKYFDYWNDGKKIGRHKKLKNGIGKIIEENYSWWYSSHANLKECAWDNVLGWEISAESTTSSILLHLLVLLTTVEFTNYKREK